MKRSSYSLPLWISGLIAILQNLAPAVVAEKWTEALLYLPLIIAISVPIYYLHSSSPTHPPTGEIFFGPGMAARQPEAVWQRKTHEADVLARLTSESTSLMVITGQSGAGKSVLLQTHILPALRSQHGDESVHVVDSYENLQAKVSAIENMTLRNAREGTPPRFLILDQAEQLHHKTAQEKKSLRDVVELWLTNNAKVLILVRDDFFYGLRFLGPLDPPPSQAFELPGIDPADPLELRQVRQDLLKVAEPECVDVILEELTRENNSKATPTLSPLELQVVGVMLERAYKKDGRITLNFYTNHLQGRTELVKEFFSAYVTASPHPHVAQSVLLVLSTESKLRRSLPLDQIYRSTYSPPEEILETLQFYTRPPGLIVQPTPTTYEWAHDQLATGFRQYSASEIDPTLRDNVFFSVEEQKEGGKSPRGVLDLEASTKPRSAWRVLLGVLTVGTLARMSLGEFFPQLYLTQGAESSALGKLYLPAGLAHLAWAVYVVRLNAGFFSRVREPLAISWKMSIVWGFFVMSAAWFYPEVWIISIGFAALALGVNFLGLASHDGLARHAALRFRRTGVLTILGGFVVTALGGVYIAMMETVGPDLVMISTVVAAGIFVGFAGPAIRLHTSRQAIEIFLGLLDRRTH